MAITSEDPRKVSLQALGSALLIALLIALALISAWRAIAAEHEGRDKLSSAFALTRQMLELKHLAAELNGWQTAYALEIWRNTPGALTDTHPARAAFLAAANTFRAKLAAIDTMRLTMDESRHFFAANRAFEQYMRLQERIVAAYRREVPELRAFANTLVLGPEILLYEQTAELVAELADRVVTRGERASVEAARASDRATTWKLVFGLTAIVLAVVFAVLNVRSLVQRIRLVGNLDALARIDPLTGIPNRRRWEEEFPLALERARRTERACAVAMIDLDKFKSFNDTNGHLAGDRLLSKTAKAFSSRLREGDLIARYGGEEFAVILHGCSANAAREILDRVRDVTPEGQTFSAGVTESDGHEDPAAVLARADQALYAAKHAGRNRTVIMRPDATVELNRDADVPLVMVQRG
jgi:diguanylate cyclase (GGDEF)-like protein